MLREELEASIATTSVSAMMDSLMALNEMEMLYPSYVDYVGKLLTATVYKSFAVNITLAASPPALELNYRRASRFLNTLDRVLKRGADLTSEINNAIREKRGDVIAQTLRDLIATTPIPHPTAPSEPLYVTGALADSIGVWEGPDGEIVVGVEESLRLYGSQVISLYASILNSPYGSGPIRNPGDGQFEPRINEWLDNRGIYDDESRGRIIGTIRRRGTYGRVWFPQLVEQLGFTIDVQDVVRDYINALFEETY